MANHDLMLGQDHNFALGQNHPLMLGHNHHNLGLSRTLGNGRGMRIEPAKDMAVQQPEYAVTAPSVLQVRTLAISPNHELLVGQEFLDVKSCRRALRDTAIALHFEMQTIKSDKTRFTAKCASEGCPWRIHAAKLPGVRTFPIRTLHGTHSCGGIDHLAHQQASVQSVANSVERCLRENPNYKPKEILEKIL
ncbi:hypothetical protein Nepgr_001431 [Nepenthes gracilis]|uniref:Transposase MuDR plant domain-containing protein n=1 Tax=Nepenthes gracilis TaxID=150966 RepID=A0AAD3P570_NEPGR|nr:hypothetical protein Nepgr_001431 [Nepenthes gracilis]